MDRSCLRDSSGNINAGSPLAASIVADLIISMYTGTSIWYRRPYSISVLSWSHVQFLIALTSFFGIPMLDCK